MTGDLRSRAADALRRALRPGEAGDPLLDERDPYSMTDEELDEHIRALGERLRELGCDPEDRTEFHDLTNEQLDEINALLRNPECTVEEYDARLEQMKARNRSRR